MLDLKIHGMLFVRFLPIAYTCAKTIVKKAMLVNDIDGSRSPAL